jgi:hypothetical protein
MTVRGMVVAIENGVFEVSAKCWCGCCCRGRHTLLGGTDSILVVVEDIQDVP